MTLGQKTPVFAHTKKFHEKLTARGVGVKPYGQPDHKRALFCTTLL